MTQASKTSDDSRPLIGAFYSNMDSIICERIVDALKKANFNISVTVDTEKKDDDEDERSNSLFHIIDTLDNMTVVLVFLSKTFSESEFCRMVVAFSSMEAKPLLPVFIDKDFELVEELGKKLIRHPSVRWRDDAGFTRFINNVKKKIGELLPSHIPTASDCKILAKFDSINMLLDEKDGSKENIDEICKSICEDIESIVKSTEDSKMLLSIAVEVFLKYNVLMGRNDDRCIEITKDTGSKIDSFLYDTLKNSEQCNPFQNYNKWAQTIFSRMFNSLATFPTTIYFLNEDFMSPQNDKCYARILFWGARVLVLACSESIFNSELDAVKFPEQQIVLQMWLKYIDKNIQMFTYTTHVAILLSILLNLTASVSLVPLFVDAYFPSTVLSWLSGKSWKIDIENTFKALCIVYNFARHDKGADALNLLGALEVLQGQRHSPRILADHPDASTVFDITLALLYKPEDINDDTLKIEPILKEALSKALSASQNENRMCGIIPLREFLLVFNTLFINEEFINITLKQTIDDKPVSACFFSDMLINTPNLDVLTMTLLLNVIYRITSMMVFNHELEQNQAFLNKLNELKDEDPQNDYLPKHTEKLQDAANGILRNLNKARRSSDETLHTDPFANQSNSVKKKVMVSYSYGNGRFCSALYDELKKDPQLDIWISYYRLQSINGDPWDHIVNAMKAADIIICILTKDYFASVPCKNELGYAIQRLKVIEKEALIPLRIGKKFKPPDSWDLRMINVQYVPFKEYKGFYENIRPSTDDQSFMATVEKLRKRILFGVEKETVNNINSHYATRNNNRMISTITDVENIINSCTTTVPNKPILQWTKEDISQWLACIPVPSKLTNLYKFQSVEELLTYASDLKEHEDAIYIDIKEEFKDEYGCTLQRKDFILLRNAFEQLLKNNHTITHTKTEPEPLKSNVCELM